MRLIWAVIPLILIVSMIGIVGIQDASASCISGSIRIDDSKYSSQHLVIGQDTLQLSGTLVNLISKTQDVVLTITSSDTRGFQTCGSPRSYLPDYANDHLPDYEKEGVHFETISATFKNISLESDASQFFEIELKPLQTGTYNLRSVALTDSYVDVNGGRTIIVKEMSPYQQIANGVSSEQIECNEDRILIHSYDYELLERIPYCVKSETVKKLDERGWIKYHPSSSLPGRYDVHVASTRITDVSGDSILYANLNQETLIIADLTYIKYKDQPLVYHVEIHNPDGTVDIHQIEDSLKQGQSLSPAISWMPTQIGTHQIELFFWESTDPLITIGSPSSRTIEVKGEL